jgi:hypothetical protein
MVQHIRNGGVYTHGHIPEYQEQQKAPSMHLPQNSFAPFLQTVRLNLINFNKNVVL